MNAFLEESLKGLRVLDASRVLAGPYCGQILGDLGADVVKVEEPREGDETRAWGPPYLGGDRRELSAYFLSCNRNKRSIALDLKTAEGRELYLRLAEKADVVLDNFRPDSARQLGVDVARLHARNPKLVHCALSGYGPTGEWGGRPGYDFVVQALSGMMAMNGPVEGDPHKFGVAIADIVTGLYAGIAVLAALNARRQSGHGYAIELALIDCAVATMANVAQAFVTSGKQPQRQGNAHLQIVPYQLFRTADSFLVLAVGNDGQWRRFCAVVGQQELGKDSRFAANAERVKNRSVLVPLVEQIMKQRTSAEWEEALTKVGVPCGPVWDFESLFASGLGRERKLKVTARRPDGSAVDLLRSPLVGHAAGMLAPPRLGEHTADVLKSWLGGSK